MEYPSQLFPNTHPHKTVSSTHLSSLEDSITEEENIYFSIDQPKKQPSHQSPDSSLKYSEISYSSSPDHIHQQDLFPTTQQPVETQDSIVGGGQSTNNRIRLWRDIESLEEHLEMLAEQIRKKDSIIREMEGDRRDLREEMEQMQRGKKSAEEKLLECECKVLELENIIIRHNIKEEGIEYKHLCSNSSELGRVPELQQETLYLLRQNSTLKLQLQEQHKIIIKYQLDGSGAVGSNCPHSLDQLLLETKSYLRESLNVIQQELVKFKSTIQDQVVLIGEKYSLMMKERQQDLQNEWRLEVSKAEEEIQRLREANQCSAKQVTESSREFQTDTKPLRPKGYNRSSLTDLNVNTNNTPLSVTKEKPKQMHRLAQPTKLLKKQIMNSGKCINISVNENEVTKEVSQTERRSRQLLEGENRYR